MTPVPADAGAVYESPRALDEYLLFHYAPPGEFMGDSPVPVPPEALGYPVRCVRETMPAGFGGSGARALDVGCAVGRSAFELARSFGTVVGLDYSRAFIAAAESLGRGEVLPYRRWEEGEIATWLEARAPAGVEPGRVTFRVADACALPEDLGTFDLVLAANLICRLPAPDLFLDRLPALVRPGGVLVLCTPATWMEEFTPRARWLGGRMEGGTAQTTWDGLRRALDGSFAIVERKELAFAIREHRRKFQLSSAEATIWKRA